MDKKGFVPDVFESFEKWDELEAKHQKQDKEAYKQRYKTLMGKSYPHDITDKVLENLIPVMKSQDVFGVDKYNQPLKSGYRYGWLDMAKEEIADMLKYLECEQERKETITSLIREAIDADDVFSKNVFLMEALDLLTITGTGK